MPPNRAYSLLTIKSVDHDQRVVIGVATTPTPDQVDDVVEPLGVEFENPLPLLLHHDHRSPVGKVWFDNPTATGITFKAQLPEIAEAGLLKDRVDLAWQSVKYGLIPGVSIGFSANPSDTSLRKGGGYLFKKSRVHELSLVTVPAHQDARITNVRELKSLDAAHLAATGTEGATSLTHPGASGRTVRVGAPRGVMAKTITEQIQGYEATRQAKSARMTELMTKAADEGVTLDAAQSEEYDTLEADVKGIDAHLVRMRALEVSNRNAAVEVKATTIEDGTKSRAPAHEPSVIRVERNLPPGLEFAQAIQCKMASFLSQGSMSPVDVAKSRYPDNGKIQQYLKATVPAGTTTHATYAGPLVDQTTLASEFVEYLRPQTIIGKFGTGNIPSLRRVPFNIRFVGQTTGGNAWWVGQGAPKPLTGFSFEAFTLLWAKVATIAVLTRELARFSSPSADMLVRDQLAAALRDQLDRDFVDPATAEVSNVSPASITNGVTPLSSAGTSADNARTDIMNLLEQFILNNINPTSVALIMPNTLALALSLMRNSLGQKEFPDITMNGGTMEGIPVITSQHAANQSGSGNLVIAVNCNEVFLADDGGVSVEASTEASLQMLDNPTNNSATGTATQMVSMFQTNSIALLAERFINWKKRRTAAVSYIDDVNWGSIGSPS